MVCPSIGVEHQASGYEQGSRCASLRPRPLRDEREVNLVQAAWQAQHCVGQWRQTVKRSMGSELTVMCVSAAPAAHVVHFRAAEGGICLMSRSMAHLLHDNRVRRGIRSQ